MKAVSFKIVAITDVTIRNILQSASCEALGLYTAYFEIAKWQETYRVKATTGFMEKRTGWKKDKVIKYKKQLIELGVLKDYRDTGEDGKIKAHYIEILHLVDDKPYSEIPEGGETRGWKNGTQVLSTGKVSAINKKKDSEQVAYNQKDYIDTMRKSEKPIDKIIGIYLMNQDIHLPTKAIAQATYVRHLRAAKQLLPWTETEGTKKMLMKAFIDVKEDSDKNNYTFTLETVYKFLTK